MKTIICPECKKEFKSLGFASHRAMHYRERQKLEKLPAGVLRNAQGILVIDPRYIPNFD